MDLLQKNREHVRNPYYVETFYKPGKYITGFGIQGNEFARTLNIILWVGVLGFGCFFFV